MLPLRPNMHSRKQCASVALRSVDARASCWLTASRLDLGGRAFDVLLALIDGAGMLVTKSELIEPGWPGQARSPEERNRQG